MATNKDVGRAWHQGKSASAGSFSTNGKDLYSYNLRIGYTHNGNKIAIDYTKGGGKAYSHTTSVHVGIAKSYADKTVKPK